MKAYRLICGLFGCDGRMLFLGYGIFGQPVFRCEKCGRYGNGT